MRRALAGLLITFVMLQTGVVSAASLRPAAHITTQTTTVLVAAVTGQFVYIYAMKVCVDGGGATTGVALQDTAGTNLIGPNVVYALLAGTCLDFPLKPNRDFYFAPTASGAGVQIVTTVGNGPVEVSLEVVQR